MSKPSPIEKVKEWFSKHCLEWNEDIESTLTEDGVKCVEHLKYLKKKEWDDLFASESKVTRRHSAHVYEEYLKGDPDPKQCALELRLQQHSEESKETKETPVSISKPGTIKADKDNKLFAGVTKATLLTKLSKEWSTKHNSQLSNKVRTILCQLFKLNYTNQDIALEVRRYSFKNIRFDESLLSSDNQYQTIMRRIRNTRKDYTAGRLNELLSMTGREKQAAMKKKSPKLGSRGRKASEQQKDLEMQLNELIEKWIKDERRITRTMIFRAALKIDPSFMGGVGSDDLMTKLKRWFYYGFVKRFNLSIHKITSVGQKLPKD